MLVLDVDEVGSAVGSDVEVVDGVAVVDVVEAVEVVELVIVGSVVVDVVAVAVLVGCGLGLAADVRDADATIRPTDSATAQQAASQDVHPGSLRQVQSERIAAADLARASPAAP